jgi:vacuolar-type H+-ATPase subunit F/Vma7
VADIAFIGQERLLRVFTYFGADVFPVSSVQEADEKLQELATNTQTPWQLIYIEEALADELQGQIKMLNRNPLPVISIVSSRGKSRGLGKTILHNLVRKATGVDMRIE